MDGILSGSEIEDLIKKDVSDPESLIITPLLNKGKQIGSDGVDIRLGTYFIVHSRTTVPCIKFGPKRSPESIAEVQSKIHIPLGQQIIIQPSTFVLGSTLEYIKLPYNLYGGVGSRSSWGRLGLVIATAINIHPYFRGCLTLELVNHGNIPIALTPGALIGQLILHRISKAPKEEKELTGKYPGSTRPEFSKIFEEYKTVKDLQKISDEYHAEI